MARLNTKKYPLRPLDSVLRNSINTLMCQEHTRNKRRLTKKPINDRFGIIVAKSVLF